MTISITQILDGGVDLKTGKELSKALVLELGGALEHMPITQEQLAIVLGLLRKASQLAERAQPQVALTTETQTVSQSTPVIAIRPTHKPQPTGDPGTFFTPSDDPPEQEGMEPGEEYVDKLTGVASF